MRTARLFLLTILCLVLAVAPAMADLFNYYSNGPINGTTNAWTISFGLSVSDSYRLSCVFFCFAQTLDVGVWLVPGDNFGSSDVDFGSTSFGSDYAHIVGAAATLVSDLGINQYGYDIREYSLNLGGTVIPQGPGYVTVGNAVETVRGDPVYWDENSGPSTAYENELGSIPSEAFTLIVDSPIFVPEPSSILLFGSGILGIAGVLRRKFNR